MKKEKKDEKREARELRKEGASIKKIASKLNVARSSVSIWVRDIILTDIQKEILKNNIPKVIPRKKGEYSTLRLEMGEDKWKEYQKERKIKNSKKWRCNNPEKYVNRDFNIKIRIIKERGGRCEKCGYSKCLGALDFHHRDPSQKEFAMAYCHRSYKKMKIESEKCDILCSNCHREIHYDGNDIKRIKRIEKLRASARVV